MSTVEAIIFDLDDTLYSERDFAFSGFDAVASQFQGVLGDSEEVAKRLRSLFDTPHRNRVFNALLDELRLPDDPMLINSMVTTYRSHSPRIGLHEDANAAIERLGRLFKLGLISDGWLETQQAKVDALDLAERLDEVILTDQWGREYWKPHCRAYEEISSRLGAKPSRCVYVADNAAKDFIAPRKLGWTTIHITRADGIYRDAQAPDNGKPKHAIKSLNELDALLGL